MNHEYSEFDDNNPVLRQCPACRRYIHMPFLSLQQCEHCGLITDFTHFTTPEQKLGCLLQSLARHIIPPFSMMGIGKLSRVSLVVALPILLFWLIALNTIGTSAWRVQHHVVPMGSSPIDAHDYIDY